jgi:transcriptional regulator with XRE-family HTH domain
VADPFPGNQLRLSDAGGSMVSSVARYENHRRALSALRERRQGAERTAADVASAVTVDMSTLAYVERGQKRASPELQAKLAEFFSCAIDELFAPLEERPSRFDPLREELLAAAGACGSPTCQDQDCPVEPGRCHGCGRTAVVARQTATDRRWVKGHPTKYCSDPGCYSGVRELESLKGATGLRSLSDLAAEAGRSAHAVWVMANRLGRGRHYPGFGRGDILLFTQSDAERIHRQIAESPTGIVHREPRRRGRWFDKRWKTKAEYGRQAPALAAEKGNKLGRKLPEGEVQYVEEQAVELLMENPDVTYARLINGLVARCEPEAYFMDGTNRKRPKKANEYRAGRKRVEKRLRAAVRKPDAHPVLVKHPALARLHRDP